MGKTITQCVPAFRRYVETSTKLGAGTRQRYAYEVELFARRVEDRFINGLTGSTLLEWNMMLVEGAQRQAP